MLNSVDNIFLPDVAKCPVETKRKLARLFSVGHIDEGDLTPTDLKYFWPVAEKLHWTPLTQICQNCECQFSTNVDKTQQSHTSDELCYCLPTFYVSFVKSKDGTNQILVTNPRNDHEVHRTKMTYDLASIITTCCVQEECTPVVYVIGVDKNKNNRFCKFDVLMRKWKKCKWLKSWYKQPPTLVSMSERLFAVSRNKAGQTVVETYTSSTDKWTREADLGPTPETAVCVVHEDKLNIFTGKMLHQFSPKTKTLYTRTSSLCVRAGAQAVSCKGYILVETDSQIVLFDPKHGSPLQCSSKTVCKDSHIFQGSGQVMRLSLTTNLELEELQDDLRWRPLVRYPGQYTALADTCTVQYPRACRVIGVPFVDYVY